MTQFKKEQLQHEISSWKRLLSFMMEENIYLKERLSQVLKENADKDFLEEMENFQTRFIKEDELVRLLRDDITKMDNLLSETANGQERESRKLGDRLKKIRKSIMLSEAKFEKLKSDFHSFLSETI